MSSRYRAIVEYDGTDFHGFQRQIGQATVQAEIERALRRITGKAISLSGAGRTDAGVHARGQVVSFLVDWRHSAEELTAALNANLPRAIAIRATEEVDITFHPRHHARSRAYVYSIVDGKRRLPLKQRYCWVVSERLDEVKMQQAAQLLVGVRDFATFGQPTQGEVTIREVYQAMINRDEEELRLRIEANAFLFRMVRSIVGTLRLVGSGRWSVDQFEAAMDAADRSLAGPTAPAAGLALDTVNY